MKTRLFYWALIVYAYYLGYKVHHDGPMLNDNPAWDDQFWLVIALMFALGVALPAVVLAVLLKELTK